eukprot:gb/GECH01011800.1/.p1 GENE.gb/GECH01011800.1/~~gb/GECH01011800.1/.p1  ORF type:complete len:473 (+),score=79.87 gb/GECH01011800.1/:1-1419(+)
MSSDIGVIGLAVMGQNVALNIAEKGFTVSVYNRTVSRVDDTVHRAEDEGQGKFQLTGYKDLSEFVSSLAKPRRVLIMVKAGKPVDMTLDLLSEHLEEGDIIIDGGNEHFHNTLRRVERMKERKINYIGMGVSGGEEGARHGPSLMPGGYKPSYDAVAPILQKIAAQTQDGPCVDYLGPGPAGQYVKMVHNGIEYGDMQLIAEAYDVLHRVGGLSNDRIAAIFERWNQGPLQSFLIEITSHILVRKDDQDKDVFLVDRVLDAARSKGTGKWTVQEAAERGMPCPTISAALEGRYMSALHSQRQDAAQKLPGQPASSSVDTEQLIQDVEDALLASKICSYAQGMSLLRQASKEFEWDLNLPSISRIWKAGCIIRAAFLDTVYQAFKSDPELPNLLVDPSVAKELLQRQGAWRRVINLSVSHGVPAPGFSASLAYFDGYRSQRLPANIIQAQRDCFGAHTYERTDQEGTFHSTWM